MSTKGDRPQTVSDWIVERLAAGDLPAERAAEVRARLLATPDGRARLERLAEDDVRMRAEHPVADMIPAIRARAAARGLGVETPSAGTHELASSSSRESVRAQATPRWGWLFGAPAFALAAAVFVVFWLRSAPPAPGPVAMNDPAGQRSGAPGAPGERIKGLPPVIHVYRHTGQGSERLADGAVARSGDLLQLTYIAAGNAYGALLSLDGAGRVTFHLGAPDGQAPVLSKAGEVQLPESYQLDDAPSFERFLFVAGDDPFSTQTLADVARGRAPAPAGTKSVTFTLRKE